MTISAQNLAGSRSNISELDIYETPEYATEALMKREGFDGSIWECACGNDKMLHIIQSERGKA